MARFFKLLFRGLSVLLIIVTLLIVTILYTETGSRWVVKYIVIKSITGLNVGKIEGTLGNKIELYDIDFINEAIMFSAKKIEYQLHSLKFFDPGVEFESITIMQARVTVPSSEEKSVEVVNEQFAGFTLPIDLYSKNIDIQELIIRLNDQEYMANKISLSLLAKEQHIAVTDLDIYYSDAKLSGRGEVSLNNMLPFKFFPKWSYNNSAAHIYGIGSIVGNISAVEVVQNISFQDKKIAVGDLQINANLDLSQEVLAFNMALTSDNINVFSPEKVVLNKLDILVSGNINNYQAKLLLDFQNNKLGNSSLKIQGDGDLSSINLKQLSLKTNVGKVEGFTNINWLDDLELSTTIKLSKLNPRFLSKQLPGNISGDLIATAIYNTNGYEIAVEKLLLEGQLKNKLFLFSAKSKIKPSGILIEKASLSLGNNTVSGSGVISNSLIDANLVADIQELSVFAKTMKGSLAANIKFSGDMSNPFVDGSVIGKSMAYKDNTIESLRLTTKGDPEKDIALNLMIINVKTKSGKFSNIQTDIMGNIASHKIMASVKEESYSSQLSLSGSWDKDKNIWLSQLSNHEFSLVDFDSNWSLTAPAKIQYNKSFSLSPACWENALKKGRLCVDTEIDITQRKYIANAELDNLEIELFKPLLPTEITLTGYLNGKANMSLIKDDLSLESDINLNQGALTYEPNEDNPYKTQIIKANFTATQKGDVSNAKMIAELADGSKLNANVELSVNPDNPITIIGDFNAHFVKTLYLSSLTYEVEEMAGGLDIDGTIEGDLSKPKIQVNARLENGYVVLTRMGSKIENLRLEIKNNDKSSYNFLTRGDSGNGNIELFGTLALSDNKLEKGWSLDANATGQNFRVLSLSEIELDITPKISIKADQKMMNIKGDVYIPYASINMQQIPTAAIISSPDIIVHDSDKSSNEQSIYSVKFDVNAIISKPIKADILGLSAQVDGKLRVNNLSDSDQVNGYGTLELGKGSYTIYGQTLDITEGELIFNGAIDNPSLNVLASRKSKNQEITAGVAIGGTVNRLESSLYSQPVTLTDLEILSYILTGQALNTENNTNPNQLAQAAIILGLQKSSPIFSELQSKLGVDVLTIKEGVSTEDSSVEAGKQVNDDLYVGYNHGLFNRTGFWLLQYKLSKVLKLESKYGADQSIDLIYTIKKK